MILRRLHLWGVQNPKYYYIGPPSVWAVAIYLLSLAPLNEVETIDRFSFPGADKLGHLFAYAMLSLLILRGWQREKMPPIGLHGFVFALCVVFGVMIEIHQSFTPYRTFEVYDILANASGALLGQIVWHLLMLRYGKRTRLYPGLFRPDFKDHPSQRQNKNE